MLTYEGVKYYNTLEAATQLEVSPTRVLQLVKRGYLGECMRGQQRALYIPESAIQKYRAMYPTKTNLKPEKRLKEMK